MPRVKEYKHYVAFRLDATLHERLVAIAAARGCSLSEEIRTAIAFHIENDGGLSDELAAKDAAA